MFKDRVYLKKNDNRARYDKNNTTESAGQNNFTKQLLVNNRRLLKVQKKKEYSMFIKDVLAKGQDPCHNDKAKTQDPAHQAYVQDPCHQATHTLTHKQTHCT